MFVSGGGEALELGSGIELINDLATVHAMKEAIELAKAPCIVEKCIRMFKRRLATSRGESREPYTNGHTVVKIHVIL